MEEKKEAIGKKKRGDKKKKMCPKDPLEFRGGGRRKGKHVQAIQGK